MYRTKLTRIIVIRMSEEMKHSLELEAKRLKVRQADIIRMAIAWALVKPEFMLPIEEGKEN